MKEIRWYERSGKTEGRYDSDRVYQEACAAYTPLLRIDTYPTSSSSRMNAGVPESQRMNGLQGCPIRYQSRV